MILAARVIVARRRPSEPRPSEVRLMSGSAGVARGVAFGDRLGRRRRAHGAGGAEKRQPGEADREEPA